MILSYCLFWLQVIANDVTAHKEEMEMLLAVTSPVQETAVSSVISGIVTRYASLITTVDSCVDLHEMSVGVHKLYCEEYHRCQDMIASEREHLQQIRDGSWNGIATVQQQTDQLKVYYLLLNNIGFSIASMIVRNLSKFHRSKC